MSIYIIPFDSSDYSSTICCRHHSLGLSRHHSLGLAIMPEVKKEFTDEEMKVCSSTN